MVAPNPSVEAPALTAEQQAEGYDVRVENGYVQVWHGNAQIALLIPSAELPARVNKVIEDRRRTLKEIEAKLSK